MCAKLLLRGRWLAWCANLMRTDLLRAEHLSLSPCHACSFRNGSFERGSRRLRTPVSNACPQIFIGCFFLEGIASNSRRNTCITDNTDREYWYTIALMLCWKSVIGETQRIDLHWYILATEHVRSYQSSGTRIRCAIAVNCLERNFLLIHFCILILIDGVFDPRWRPKW